jgi:hypothetical protein
MDMSTLITSAASSLGISAVTAGWLSKQLVAHRLNKDIENYKNVLTQSLEDHKSKLAREADVHRSELERVRDEWQAALRRETEIALGEHAAEREYHAAARKRLFEATGPLRFQLLLSCRELTQRVKRHLTTRFAMGLDGYYGQSTLYRILRPLVISELIERQVTSVDFAVDPSSIDVLRFRRAAFLAWTDGGITLNHPAMKWKTQEFHVFSDSLRRAYNSLIVHDSRGDRVMHYDEFEAFVAERENVDRLHPFPHLLDGFSIERKPILWLRLVCFGYICNAHVTSAGQKIGFSAKEFPVHDLVSACPDDFVQQHLEEYERRIAGSAAVDL